MIKFLLCPAIGRAYLMKVVCPEEFKKFLQNITRPQNNVGVVGRRKPISANNVPPSWKQLINQIARYTDAHSLTYYNPKTQTLFIVTVIDHDFIGLDTMLLTENRNKDWLERFSLDPSDLTLTIV